jgi:hypothetical protein
MSKQKPKSKDAPKTKSTISKADDLIKGGNAELEEEDLKRVVGGAIYLKQGA